MMCPYDIIIDVETDMYLANNKHIYSWKKVDSRIIQDPLGPQEQSPQKSSQPELRISLDVLLCGTSAKKK